MDRRTFVAALSGSPLLLDAGATQVLREANRYVSDRSPAQLADDESYWLRVRQAFTLDANHVNLNSGSVSPAPRVVSEAMQRYWTLTNMAPSYYVDELLYPEVELVRRRLAAVFGCATDELALTRNTSESLQIVQLGLPL
jgi:isopenicillin-N epimerase